MGFDKELPESLPFDSTLPLNWMGEVQPIDSDAVFRTFDFYFENDENESLNVNA